MTDRPSRNLELKVRCDAEALAAARARLLEWGTTVATLAQRDTYFTVERGRLKLREITTPGDEPAAELIAYERPNAAGPRWSAYHRVEIAAAEAELLRTALNSTLGVLVEVVKIREVAILSHTRVHLDRVQNLGEFIELETVVTDQNDAAAAAELARIAHDLGLDPLERISGSYSDELLRR